VTSTLIAGLASGLAERAAAGLARTRRVVESAQGRMLAVDGRELVSFASNDYLGLAAHPAVAAAARAAIER
jgi:8-amino-7-oxononanoate synthase